MLTQVVPDWWARAPSPDSRGSTRDSQGRWRRRVALLPGDVVTCDYGWQLSHRWSSSPSRFVPQQSPVRVPSKPQFVSAQDVPPLKEEGVPKVSHLCRRVGHRSVRLGRGHVGSVGSSRGYDGSLVGAYIGATEAAYAPTLSVTAAVVHFPMSSLKEEPSGHTHEADCEPPILP